MNFCVVCIGKIKDSFYRERILEISGKINRGQNAVEIVEFKDEKIPERVNEKERVRILETEGKRILSKLDSGDYVIALCVEGKEITTKQHAAIVGEAREDGRKRTVYVIGGSLGLSEEVKKRADKKISFSKMTFPHQLMRMVLLEEISHMTDYL